MPMRVAHSDKQGLPILADGQALDIEPVLLRCEVGIVVVEVADSLAKRFVVVAFRRPDGFRQPGERL